MPRTQQRAQRNRRPVRPNTPELTPTLIAVIAAVEAHTVQMYFLNASQPPSQLTDSVPIVLQGIPKLRRLITNEYPVGAVLGDANRSLTLTYGGTAMTSEDTFLLGPKDPAIRTTAGGYSGPLIYGETSQPIPSIDWTATSTGLYSVNIIPASVPPNGLYMDPRRFFSVELGLPPERGTWTGTQLELEYISEVSIGSDISYQAITIMGDGDDTGQFMRVSREVQA